MIEFMETPRKGRKSRRMDRSWKKGYSLNIDTVLRKSRETSIVEARKKTIERMGFADWKIWKLLHIEWG